VCAASTEAQSWTEKPTQFAPQMSDHSSHMGLLREHVNGSRADDDENSTPTKQQNASSATPTPDARQGLESHSAASTAKKGRKESIDEKDTCNDTASPANSIALLNYIEDRSDAGIVLEQTEKTNCGGAASMSPARKGAAAGVSKVVPTLGIRAQTLPIIQNAGHSMGIEALNQVIRSTSLTSRDKLRRLQIMCVCPEGWLVRHCLDGNGWNPKRQRLEGCPTWATAVHSLTISLSAIAEGKQPPKSFDEEATMVYMKHDGARNGLKSYTVCSCMEASASWLTQILKPTANILRLDLSATGHLQLKGRGIRELLDPLFKGTRIKELSVAGSPLQDAGARTLAELIAHPLCTLESLDASDCLFWTVGCAKILEGSMHSPSLRHLSLAKNDVGTPGALVVARLLKREEWGMLSLDLSHVRCSVQGMQAIAEALPHNNHMLSLNLDGNDPGYAEESWRRVIETHRFLQKLTLPRPVVSMDTGALEFAAQQRIDPILPPIDLQLAVAMCLHNRLGQDSLLHQLPETLVQIIVQRSSSPFQLRLLPEAEAAA